MRSRKISTAGFNKVSTNEPSTSDAPQQRCYEGENLTCLLKLIRRELESARNLDTGIPEKVWLKQQFAIGVNEVTRVLERMQPVSSGKCSPHGIGKCKNEMPLVSVQAILLASDCNPRWLSKHLPDLANSRGVPLLFVKDNKGGSLRLGELVKLKTAIAIGIKTRGNAINHLVQKVLDNEIQVALNN